MNQAARLTMPLARLRPANQVPAHIELVDLPVAVAAEQVLIRQR